MVARRHGSFTGLAACSAVLLGALFALSQRSSLPVLAAEPAQPGAPTVAGAKGGEPAYLGLVVDDQNDRGRGVRVVGMRPNGPAALAGFQPGDLVTAVAGVPIRQLSDLADVLSSFSAGAAVGVKFTRNGQQKEVQVTLARRPEGAVGGAPIAPGQPSGSGLPAPPPAPAEESSAMPTPAGAPSTGGPSLMPPQSAETADPYTLIERLSRRIEQLERRVDELEKTMREKMSK